MSKYALEVTANAYDLCVFLNDGNEIETTDDAIFLLVEIHGPREITSKIITKQELKSAKYKEYLPLDT